MSTPQANYGMDTEVQRTVTQAYLASTSFMDALELNAQGGAERLDEEGLGEAGHALEQHMAVGEEGDEQALDDGILADDSLADFCAEFLGPSGAVNHGR